MKNILCNESDAMIKAIEDLLNPLGFNIIESYGQEITEKIDYFIFSARNTYCDEINLSELKKVHGNNNSKIIIISFDRDYLEKVQYKYKDTVDHLYLKRARTYDLDALYIYNDFILKK